MDGIGAIQAMFPERFCGAEGLENVIPVTELRKRAFGEDYGV